MERRVCKNLILALRELHSQEIFLGNRNIIELANILAEYLGGFVVWLDGDYVFDAARKGIRDDARTGADIDHGVTFLDIAMTNQKSSEPRVAKKMLAEFWLTHLAVTPSGARPRTLRSH